MLKKALAGAAILTLLVVVGLYFFTRSILASDAVRETLTAQVSKAIGQPVSIASIDATILPRITVRLGGVAIGRPAKIQVQTLNVGTGLRALLSRRIEHASLRLEGAHIALPLPTLSIGGGDQTPPSEEAPGGAAVELVSIDEVVLKDVEIESAGRTLHADIEAVPEGKGMAVRRFTLRAEDTTIEATGNLADLAGPTGELTLKADALNLDRMVTFLSSFSAGAGVSTPKQSKMPARSRAKPVSPKTGMNIVLTLDANRATLGSLALDRLSGRARVTDRAVTLDPMTFELFKGRYEGTMVLDLGESEGFQLKASVANVDVAAAMAFAGVPNTITGQMSGRMDVAGRGLDAARAMKSARGTVRLDVKDGIVKNLGLLRTVVLATSMRG
ncbi:MAG TPA: AsmA family protein, partial [Vicinamibacterales bacterium]|nr:AsmA family protein [Vicinamibacterales bacterium]